MSDVMVLVGDIIEKGEPIPARTIAVDDKVGDGWAPRPGSPGCWYCVRYDGEPYDLSDTITGDALSRNWGPLTVTAVREPRVPFIGERTSTGSPEEFPAVREPERKVERAGWPEDEVVHYRIPGDASPLTLCGLDVWSDDTSVTERAGSSNCPACRAAADEDEPAAPSVLLDLVRQYGDQRGMLEVRRPHMAAASAERWDASIAALCDQIAVAAQRLSENDATGDLQAQRDEALSEVERLRRLLKDQASNFAAATTRAGADPSVLSLPPVPPGTVALIGGKTQRRYVPAEFPSRWTCDENGYSWSLAELFVDEGGSVTVVKREPRTWARIETEDHDPDVVDVEDSGRWVREPDSAFYRGQGAPRTLAALRELGDVTEVFE